MRYWVVFLLCSAAVIAYVQRNAITLPAPEIQKELGFDKRDMGSVMGAFYLGYAVLQIPAGWLADRWGSRRSLALYAAAWSFFTGLTGLATDLPGLMVLWGLAGLAQAGIFPAAARAIGDWLPDAQRAFASGLLGASQLLGAGIAPALTGRLLGLFSWREVFALYALPGIAWALVYLMFTRDPARSTTAAAREPIDWQRLLRSSSMGLLCLQQFLRASAMAFFFTWFPTYLREAREVSTAEAGQLTSWVLGAAMLGAVVGGRFSDWLLRRTGWRRLSRQGIAVVGMTLCALLAVAAYAIEDTRQATTLLSLGAFWGSFGGVSGYSVTIDFAGTRIGVVFSVMNTCGNLGASWFPVAVAWLVAWTGSWDLVFFLFAACFAVDAVCWALLNPKGPLFEESHGPNPDTAEPMPGGAGAH